MAEVGSAKTKTEGGSLQRNKFGYKTQGVKVMVSEPPPVSADNLSSPSEVIDGALRRFSITSQVHRVRVHREQLSGILQSAQRKLKSFNIL